MTAPQTPTPPKRVSLRWTGSGLEYRGAGETGPELVLDGKSGAGQGPMDALLLSLAGCMALDVQTILEKSRVPLTGMEVEVEGQRAQFHPRRYTEIRLVYRLEGPEEEHQGKVDRAVELSREKFCSVLHSLRTDIDFEIEVHRV